MKNLLEQSQLVKDKIEHNIGHTIYIEQINDEKLDYTIVTETETVRNFATPLIDPIFSKVIDIVKRLDFKQCPLILNINESEKAQSLNGAHNFTFQIKTFKKEKAIHLVAPKNTHIEMDIHPFYLTQPDDIAPILGATFLHEIGHHSFGLDPIQHLESQLQKISRNPKELDLLLKEFAYLEEFKSDLVATSISQKFVEGLTEYLQIGMLAGLDHYKKSQSFEEQLVDESTILEPIIKEIWNESSQTHPSQIQRIKFMAQYWQDEKETKN